MISTIRNVFRPPCHMAIAKQELEEAKRDLLTAQAYREHYQHTERMLVERINRLSAMLKPEGSAA